GLLLDTDDLDVFVNVQLTALNTTGDNGATTGNGEDVLDRHQEWLVSFTNWVWDGVIASLHQVNDGLYPLLFAVQGAQSGDVNDWSFLVELLLSQKFTNFHLNELDDFLIVNHVTLVPCNEDVRKANLERKNHVLTWLWHWAIGRSNTQDSPVHLSRTGNHALAVVRVAWSVYVCVVALKGGVLYVGDVNGNSTLLLLRSLIDHVVSERFVLLRVLVCQYLGDSCGRGGLTVVDVSDGADVYVRLRTLKLSLCHCMSSWTSL